VVFPKDGTLIPPDVIPENTEFVDVFPEDLPDQLLPMCDIQYAIDLVPVLDLPYYRINPTKYTELKRQVDELSLRSSNSALSQ